MNFIEKEEEDGIEKKQRMSDRRKCTKELTSTLYLCLHDTRLWKLFLGNFKEKYYSALALQVPTQ